MDRRQSTWRKPVSTNISMIVIPTQLSPRIYIIQFEMTVLLTLSRLSVLIWYSSQRYLHLLLRISTKKQTHKSHPYLQQCSWNPTIVDRWLETLRDRHSHPFHFHSVETPVVPNFRCVPSDAVLPGVMQLSRLSGCETWSRSGMKTIFFQSPKCNDLDQWKNVAIGRNPHSSRDGSCSCILTIT